MSKVRHLGLGGIDKVLPYLVHAPWTLDRLESLYLIGSGRDEDDRKDILTFDFFNKAPNLQKVTITNGSVSTDDSRRILPWSKITSLILTELLYLEDWVQVVESCPQLRTADFTVINCREEELDGFRDRKRVHQCLEDLTFEPQFGSVSVFDILSIFNFPMLRCLDLRTKKNTDSDVCIAPNSSNALRNLASIRSLVVNEGWDSDIGVQVLAEFLQECSNLVDLSLISLSPRLLPLFEDMGLSFAAPHILPHLAVLNISFSQVISTPLADIDAFCEIVKLRLMSDIGSFGFQPLKKVFIHVPPSYRGVGAQERMKAAILTHSLSHESVTFTESWEVGSLGRPRESPSYIWYANARAW